MGVRTSSRRIVNQMWRIAEWDSLSGGMAAGPESLWVLCQALSINCMYE